MLLRAALISLFIALVAGIPGFAFGSALLWEIDRMVFLLFVHVTVILFIVNYILGAPREAK
jgi:hypothetical protein